MKTDVLPYLSCPRCQANLKLTTVHERGIAPSGKEEIISGELVCATGHVYRVINGIPRLVISEISGFEDIHTGKKFSESWTQFHRFHQDYIQQFFDWMAPVNRAFVKDKLVLDAGCGKGRHARVLSESGAAVVIAADIGDSVDVAYANLRAFDNVHVVQGDIKALPVKPIFDLVYSTGVLHHMADPLCGFRSLWQMVNHNGTLAVWVYGKENNWWITTFVNPVRKFTCRAPQRMLRMLSRMLAVLVFYSSQFIYKPWHQLRSKATYLPALFYESYMSYISSFDYEEIDHIVYDHLVAPIAFYLSREEVVSWSNAIHPPFSQIRWHNQNSWTLVVSKNANLGVELKYPQNVGTLTNGSASDSAPGEVLGLPVRQLASREVV